MLLALLLGEGALSGCNIASFFRVGGWDWKVHI